MLSFLKNHPFAVEAFFESSLVLTFALPKEQLQDLIPECLQLDTFQDKWAFVAVAMEGGGAHIVGESLLRELDEVGARSMQRDLAGGCQRMHPFEGRCPLKQLEHDHAERVHVHLQTPRGVLPAQCGAQRPLGSSPSLSACIHAQPIKKEYGPMLR